VRGPESGKTLVLKFFFKKGEEMHQAKLWASQAFELAKIKGNLQQPPLLNTTELCSHSQPSQDWQRLHLDTRPFVQIATELHKSSQQKQTTHVNLVLNVKFISLFIYYSVHDEKLNLLTWAIRLVFSDWVTYIKFNIFSSGKEQWLMLIAKRAIIYLKHQSTDSRLPILDIHPITYIK